MWVVISGPPGSGKHEIAKYLAKQGYTYDEVEPVVFSEHMSPQQMFDVQLTHLLSRFERQRVLQKIGGDEDVVTVGSFWDVHEVYSMVMSRFGMFADGGFINLNRIYNALGKTLDSPHKVIFTVSSKLDAEAKMAIRAKSMLNEEFYDAVVGAYRTYMDTRVRCPHQEIDISIKPFDQTLLDVVAALSYGEKVQAKTLWKKDYLR